MKHPLIEEAEEKLSQVIEDPLSWHRYRGEIEGIKAGLLAGYKEELEFLTQENVREDHETYSGRLLVIENRIKELEEKIRELKK